jgi:hypothetical protein
MLVGVLGGPGRPRRAGAEPEAALVGLEPRRAVPAAVTEPVNGRVLDREDPLRPRGAAARLGDERAVKRAKVTSIGGAPSSRSSRTQRSVTRVRPVRRVAIRRPTVVAGRDRTGAVRAERAQRRASVDGIDDARTR